MASKVKDKHVEALVEEYRKRLRPFGGLEIIEGLPKKGLPVKQAGEIVIGMDPTGKKMSSEELADFIQSKETVARKISFHIGEAEGLDDRVKQEADMLLSLSDMVMAHRISLIVLAEQIYRAHTIISGHPYHK